MPRSTKSSPSPPQGQVSQPEESRLPEGYCRYLLPQAELKGQRCGCAHFTLNRSIPSATCTCGHQSCFHTSEPYSPEVEHLRNKLKALQAQFDQEQEEKLGLVARLSNLEEIVEKSREEASLEIKGSYQNLSRAWQSVRELERQNQEHQHRFRRHSEQIESLQDEVHRLDNRQLELSDADISLEERIEALEDLEEPSTPLRHRRSSGLDVPSQSSTAVDSTLHTRSLPIAPAMRPAKPVTPMTDSSRTWTVHISLLPTSTLPFPFEKDTNAYKRCLSRGLHQMVVITGFDAESFTSAVSKAFASLLRGRPWMPLQARLCNAETLQGLPMLRQLDESLVHGRYDSAFLCKHCAVCDANGKMDSLYISMRYDTFSWHALRQAPIFVQGLESCWVYDSYLDPVNPFDDDAIEDSDRPSAGDILPPTLSTLKRAASEMSRSSSFGASATPAGTGVTSEGEGSRPKLARVVPNIGESRRRVETV